MAGITRRTLAAGALAASLPGASARFRPGCQTNAWRIDPERFDSFLAVLDRIRHYGYRGFETGFRNLQNRFDKAPAVRAEFEKRGLVFLGFHIFLPEYDSSTLVAPRDLIDAVAAGAASLGAERLILSGRAAGRDSQSLERKCRELSRAGRACAKRKLRLCYHNHDAEFARDGAEIGYLLRRTDPEFVSLLLDAGHAIRGGADVASFAADHAERIDGIHLRDSRSGAEVPLGEGEVDYKPLAKALRAARWSGWLINEEERLNDGRPGDQAVEPARKGLKKVFGV